MKKAKKLPSYSGRCIEIEYIDENKRQRGKYIIESNFYLAHIKKFTRLLKKCEIISMFERAITKEDGFTCH